MENYGTIDGKQITPRLKDDWIGWVALSWIALAVILCFVLAANSTDPFLGATIYHLVVGIEIILVVVPAIVIVVAAAAGFLFMAASV